MCQPSVRHVLAVRSIFQIEPDEMIMWHVLTPATAVRHGRAHFLGFADHPPHKLCALPLRSFTQLSFLLPIILTVGNVRQGILGPLRHVQNVVVPLMIHFFIVQLEEVYLCIGVPVTVPIGELSSLADRELITCTALSFHFSSQLCHRLDFSQYRGCMCTVVPSFSSSIASCWANLDLNELIWTFPPAQTAIVPGTFVISAVCFAMKPLLSTTC